MGSSLCFPVESWTGTPTNQSDLVQFPCSFFLSVPSPGGDWLPSEWDHRPGERNSGALHRPAASDCSLSINDKCKYFQGVRKVCHRVKSPGWSWRHAMRAGTLPSVHCFFPATGVESAHHQPPIKDVDELVAGTAENREVLISQKAFLSGEKKKNPHASRHYLASSWQLLWLNKQGYLWMERKNAYQATLMSSSSLWYCVFCGCQDADNSFCLSTSYVLPI